MAKVKTFFIIGNVFIFMLPLMYISCSDIMHIAGSYYCYQDNTPICAIHNFENSNMNIPPTVLKYIVDGTHIIVMQKPAIPEDAMYRPVHYPNYSQDSLYYWIIEFNCDSIVGPLDYKSFLIECDDRNIDASMLFK